MLGTSSPIITQNLQVFVFGDDSFLGFHNYFSELWVILLTLAHCSFAWVTL